MNTSRKKQTKRWKKVLKRIIILIIVLAAIAVGVFIGLDSLKTQYTVKYDPYTATIGSISNSLSFSGSLSLVNNTTYTATSSATVRGVYASAGDKVTDGQKLVRLSNGQLIKAEFDGTVNVLDLEVGDSVSMGETLVQVSDFTNMQVTIRVDEYDISSVHVGDTVTVTATATEKSFPSIIKSINYISASAGNVAYYSALLDVTVDEGIYPGMQVTVTIPQESAENVVVLKEDALSFDSSNNAYVLVKNDDGTMEQRTVEVGVSNGNYVEIKSGISEGETVYAVSTSTESSALTSMMSSMFGSTQINGGGSMPSGDFSMPSGDFSFPSSGDSSSSSSGGHGNRSGGSDSGSGMPSGFGGGN